MNKIKSSFVLLIAAVAFAGASKADSKFLTACKADLEKMNCPTNAAEEAHSCLEKNENDKKKYGGLSKSCHSAEEKYEKASGKGMSEAKEEKNEKK